MYQALYRQYRPKSFDELLGQNHINSTLKSQIKNENIGHAYLFSGTRGTGKTSSAKIFSRAVNCLNSKDGNPCNECNNCKEILEETTMDVIEMDAASNNSVDDIRELRDRVIYPPSNIKYKVYIIDEIHMLSKSAFNALLKTLEEPPQHLIFILATTEPERLPQTILSRCQRFDFKRIGIKDIISNMKNILSELDMSMEKQALNLIARNADGSMRDALSLLEQCVSFNREKITYDEVIDILGIANRDLIFETVDNIKDKKIEKTLLAIDDIIQNGKDIHQFMKDLIQHYRNLMIIKSSNNLEEFLEIEDVEKYKEQSKDMDLNYILKSLEILTDAEVQGKWSTQIRIILEMAAIKMVKIEETISLEARIKKLEEGYIIANKVENHSKSRGEVPSNQSINQKKPIKNEKSKVEQKENKKTEFIDKKSNIIDKDEELNIEIIREHWPKITEEIKSKKISIYALIIEGKVTTFNNNLLTIAYEDGFGFHKDAINSPSNKPFVEKVISQYFNREISVNFIMNNTNIGQEDLKEDNKDESIKEVLEVFGEDIVELK